MLNQADHFASRTDTTAVFAKNKNRSATHGGCVCDGLHRRVASSPQAEKTLSRGETLSQQKYKPFFSFKYSSRSPKTLRAIEPHLKCYECSMRIRCNQLICVFNEFCTRDCFLGGEKRVLKPKFSVEMLRQSSLGADQGQESRSKSFKTPIFRAP